MLGSYVSPASHEASRSNACKHKANVYQVVISKTKPPRASAAQSWRDWTDQPHVGVMSFLHLVLCRLLRFRGDSACGRCTAPASKSSLVPKLLLPARTQAEHQQMGMNCVVGACLPEEAINF